MKARSLAKTGLMVTLLLGAFQSFADESGLQALMRAQVSAHMADTQYTLQNEVYADVVRSGIHFDLQEEDTTYATRVTITDIDAESKLHQDSE